MKQEDIKDLIEHILDEVGDIESFFWFCAEVFSDRAAHSADTGFDQKSKFYWTTYRDLLLALVGARCLE